MQEMSDYGIVAFDHAQLRDQGLPVCMLVVFGFCFSILFYCSPDGMVAHSPYSGLCYCYHCCCVCTVCMCCLLYTCSTHTLTLKTIVRGFFILFSPNLSCFFSPTFFPISQNLDCVLQVAPDAHESRLQRDQWRWKGQRAWGIQCDMGRIYGHVHGYVTQIIL